MQKTSAIEIVQAIVLLRQTPKAQGYKGVVQNNAPHLHRKFLAQTIGQRVKTIYDVMSEQEEYWYFVVIGKNGTAYLMWRDSGWTQYNPYTVAAQISAKDIAFMQKCNLQSAKIYGNNYWLKIYNNKKIIENLWCRCEGILAPYIILEKINNKYNTYA